MTILFWDYYEYRKNESQKDGETFTIAKLAKELKIDPSHLWKVIRGEILLTEKLANRMQENSNDQLKAINLLEESRHWHSNKSNAEKKFFYS